MQRSIRHIKKFQRASAAVAITFACVYLLQWLFPVPDNVQYSTIITDNKNEIIHAYLTKDQKWRLKTHLNEISPLLRKAIIEKEDKYFYHHPGINPFSMAKALAGNILRLKRTSGASTITMQVARALEPKKRTYLNKCIEVFRAAQLEWKYSKNEILQLYLNLVPYGGNIEGVKAASILYFNKSPDHLSLAEITALSVIPNRPSLLVMGRNNSRIVAERNNWLKRFGRENIFNKKQIDDALSEPLTANRGSFPKLLPQLCYKLKQERNGVITTNIELNAQLKIEKLVEDYARGMYHKNIRNAAVIVIDNFTHKVISYVGSANFTDTIDGGQVNGAAAIRQPGSTLKPLLYGLCIDAGLMTPKTVIADVAVNIGGYAPENYERRFNGYVSMEYALEHSLNIPAVKSLRLLGKDQLVQPLAACGFQQVKNDQHKLGLSLILGGCGTTLEELTGLYSSFASEGVFIKPSITTSDTMRSPVKVLSPAAAFMINETLSRVHRPDFPVNWQSTERMPKIAWKTGTSYGRRDAWSIGYNRHFTIGVWAGNFSGQGIPELNGADIATPLLFKIFNTIDYDSDQEWFRQPGDCDTRLVCGETGLVPDDQCTETLMDYFIPLISPSKKCEHVREMIISADEKIAYCRSCMPENGYRKKPFRMISPEMQSYFDDNQIAYDKIPRHNPDCEKIFAENHPVITSPDNNSAYFISKKNPEPLQLTCSIASDAGRVFWYINDKFYKSSEANTKQFFIPEEGPVKISCTDDKGRNKDIRISVKYVDL